MMMSSKSLNAGVVNNRGRNTLSEFLRATATPSSRIDIGVAFVSAKGLNSILFRLKQSRGSGRVRLLTGTYQSFTDPSALRSLMKAEQELKGRLSARLAANDRFHWKAYLVAKGATCFAAIGSSNLTGEGLTEDGELSLVLESRAGSREWTSLTAAFEEEWSSAAPLSNALIAQYETHREAFGVPKTVPPFKLRRSQRAKAVMSTDTQRDVRYWRTNVLGECAKETVDFLDDELGWARFESFNCLPKAAKGDRVILFDFTTGRLRTVEIVRTEELPFSTPDGRCFQAYREVPRSRYRRLIPSLFKQLKQEGLLRKKPAAFRNSAISKETFNRFVEVIWGM
jgi:HKD family nuclease